MTESILSRAFTITDRRAAAALSQPLRRRIVLLLAVREFSLAEIAALLRKDLKYLHYHIGVLQRLGLLKVVRERARPGRSIKVYRAVSQSFLVPGRVVSAGPSVAMYAELRNSLSKAHESSPGGTLYDVDENDQPRMRFIAAAPKPNPATELWQVLALSKAEAMRLAKDIAHRLSSSKHLDHAACQDYLVHVAIAPRVAAKADAVRVSRRLQRL